ncbi:MAG TPA: sporulation peptidase YabG [Clostridia bacterium]|nr:sporulation peptidase YabG [Clostridia bacterium]
MSQLKPGDVVVRKSYGGDIFFKVRELRKNPNGTEEAVLTGLDVRLVVDAPVSDLEKKDAASILQYRHHCIQMQTQSLRNILARREMERKKKELRNGEDAGGDFFEVPGRVLHLDGDEDYLEKCLHTYKQLGVPAFGFAVPEKDQPKRVMELVREYNPDILVLTGHDALKKGTRDFSDLDNYKHSRYFIEAVRKVRQVIPSRDDLVIFAGACQSHYEGILCAGANFASSPQRVMIHAYDPVFIVERLAYTSINESISIRDIIETTITGIDGVGGIETRGRFRLGYPKSPY